MIKIATVLILAIFHSHSLVQMLGIFAFISSSEIQRESCSSRPISYYTRNTYRIISDQQQLAITYVYLNAAHTNTHTNFTFGRIIKFLFDVQHKHENTKKTTTTKARKKKANERVRAKLAINYV